MVAKIDNSFPLPENLPLPVDDGACSHLPNKEIPSIKLRSIKNRWVDLRQQSQTPTVIFFYPRTGEPGKPIPQDWDIIPGARGCTPQSCGFRDIHQQFLEKGFAVFGISSQDTAYQQEFAERMHLPFEILSDEQFMLTNALSLPTFFYYGEKLIKRFAIIVDKGKIIRVFYPVFPPNENAGNVLKWIQSNQENLLG